MKFSTAHFPRGTIVEYCVGNPEFKEYKGVLTTEETKQHSVVHNRIVTHQTSFDDFKYFFFSDDHGFGHGVLPDDFVPCTAYLPLEVTPREGLEDGIVDTVEKYMFIFCKDKKQINSIEELCEYLNTREDQALDESFSIKVAQKLEEEMYEEIYEREKAVEVFDGLESDGVNDIDGFMW